MPMPDQRIIAGRWATPALLMLSLAMCGPSTSAPASGGSACVVAKKQGNSLAIEWSLNQPSVDLAIDIAKQALRAKGHEDVFPQANSALPHGWFVAVRTEYRTYTGRMRVSFGCGFSPISYDDATQRALIDLQSYSWGWRPEHGYQILNKSAY